MSRADAAATLLSSGAGEGDAAARAPVPAGQALAETARLAEPFRTERVASAKDERVSRPGALLRTVSFARCKLQGLQEQAGARGRRMVPLFAFAREMLTSPSAIGAVCPSSSDLARAMAREVGCAGDGLVVELGAGTGSITHALLQQGIPPGNLVAIERSPLLASHLRRRFPDVRVIVGDATQLGKLLASDARRVRAVVSGLPLRSLPKPVVRGVLRQIRRVLPAGGLFVQFTYDLRNRSLGRARALRLCRTRVIWRNIPPARVDTFVRQAYTPRPIPAGANTTVVRLQESPGPSSLPGR